MTSKSPLETFRFPLFTYNSFMSKKMDKNLNEENKDAMDMESKKDIEKKATAEPDDESDDEEEEGRFRIVPNATTISNDYPHLFPKNSKSEEKMDENLNEEIKDDTTQTKSKKESSAGSDGEPDEKVDEGEKVEGEAEKEAEAEKEKEVQEEKKENEKINERFKYMPNATTISNDFPHLFPKVYKFLFNMVKDIEIEINRVGPSFNYHPSVYYNKSFTFHSLYINYFIRKHLAAKHDVELRDRRAERVIEHSERFETGTNPKLKAAIEKHYKIFTDRNTKAIDISYSIKVVSLSHGISFRERVPETEFDAYHDNLVAIVKYLDSLVYNTVEINPKIDCEYFKAEPNIIFDGEVVFQIKVSKLISLDPDLEVISRRKFVQLLLYSFAYYKLTKKKILKLVIYNPLLSYEYVMELDDIDYERFEAVLEKAVTAFQIIFPLLYESDDSDETGSDDEEKADE
uniref:Uncharacterized protein n=1 Tax=Glossina austeni TaxID=7395 RepID=A0A1A9USB9_GLOAU